MTEAKKKTEKCPECGSWRIAEIPYGMPSMDARLERDLEAGNQHRHLSELTYSFLYGF
ncbi:MAG: hypothetical protein SWH78_10260 [Thermodesulfobacteriota bacterium]|nr:hypothetical protein [Thermodesulfobacteriota bacterium]